MQPGDIVRYFLRGYDEFGLIIDFSLKGVDILWFNTGKVGWCSLSNLEVVYAGG